MRGGSAGLIVVAVWLFEAGCGSPGAKTPDAAGVDGPLDVAAMDVAQDSGSSDRASGDVTGPADGNNADGTDGGDDPCYPPCRTRIYGGCPIAGTCVYSAGTFCYSNGVIIYTSPPGNTTIQTFTKNGVVCATLDFAYVFHDPSGAALGTLAINADGSATYTCTGEAPVTIPVSCTIPCGGGMCPP